MSTVYVFTECYDFCQFLLKLNTLEDKDKIKDDFGTLINAYFKDKQRFAKQKNWFCIRKRNEHDYGYCEYSFYKRSDAEKEFNFIYL